MNKLSQIINNNYRIAIDVIVVVLILIFSNVIYGENMNNAIFINSILILFFLADLIFLYLKMTNFLKDDFKLNELLLGRHLHFIFYAFVLIITGNKLYTNENVKVFEILDLRNPYNIIWYLIIISIIIIIAIYNFIYTNRQINLENHETENIENPNVKSEENKSEQNDRDSQGKKKEYEHLKWIARGLIIIVLSALLIYVANVIDFNKLFKYEKIFNMVVKLFIAFVIVPLLIITMMVVCSVIVMAYQMIIDSIKTFKQNAKNKEKDEKLSKNYLYLISAFIFIFIMIFVYQTIIVGASDRLGKEFMENFKMNSVYITGAMLLAILLYFLLAHFLVSLAVDKGANSLYNKVQKAAKDIGENFTDYCKALLEGPKNIILLFSEMLVALCDLIVDDEESGEEVRFIDNENVKEGGKRDEKKQR